MLLANDEADEDCLPLGRTLPPVADERTEEELEDVNEPSCSLGGS